MGAGRAHEAEGAGGVVLCTLGEMAGDFGCGANFDLMFGGVFVPKLHRGARKEGADRGYERGVV